ncbi:MAG: DHH family phosphoesterase [Thermoplasmata archaeon]|uniref:DHH family phosphoesterase n=1 Tax=Candidatus Sysuiplasma superficiale TaxID=2823368 RepID=A0A8J7YT34_9ARCH|nr:DHH family phosphoesterase [Candidatus Sysuiplasma superficiale]
MKPTDDASVFDGAIRLLESKVHHVYVLHPHPDADCVASAYALYSAFPGAAIWSPSKPDRFAQLMIERHSIPVAEEFPDQADLAVILDTPHTAFVRDHLKRGTSIMVIDHHEQGQTEENGVTLSLTVPRAPSCSEIVAELLLHAGRRPERNAAEVLLIGILSDTGGLKRATASTLRTCASLLELAGLEIQSPALSRSVPMEEGEQVAVLKGMQRMVYRRVGGFTVCCTHSSAFESTVASVLLSAGADAVFVAAESGGFVRVTGRASERVLARGFNLVTLFRSIAAGFGGETGGHPGAAVLKSEADMEALLNSCAAEFIDWCNGV